MAQKLSESESLPWFFMLANLTSTSTQWTLSDEKLLFTFLHEHWAASGDGGKFKTATFQAAAAVLEAEHTSREPKTVKACQNKWASVSLLCFIHSGSILTVFLPGFL